ncbi:MAG: NAD(P)-binding domain-containing protein [Defluviitaleaceae bacterium]|nr:NAD(P)-binding domain-containing protein [Defluviitaleaceae bacterium]
MFSIGAIGAGHMGMAILEAVVAHSSIEASDVLVYELNPERRREAKAHKFAAAGNEYEVFVNTKLLLLAVPPQACEELLIKLSRYATKQEDREHSKEDIPVIISIMAGISSEYIRSYLGQDTPVITLMPTMGMKVGQGAAALAHTNNVPEEVLKSIMQILSATGEALVVSEPLLKEIVAIGGCMPGYAFYLIDAFAQAVQERGVDYRIAVRMAARGFMGAAIQILEGGDPNTLLSHVCTPGGLTAQGVDSFRQNQADVFIKDCIVSSIRRGYELSK